MAYGSIFFGFYMFAGAFTGYCSKSKSDSAVCERITVQGLNVFTSLFLGSFGYCWLWTGQYVYISQSGKETGKLFGIFYSLFQFNQVFGNLFNYIYYSFSPNIELYFTIFVVVSLLTSIGFATLPKIGIEEKKIKLKEKEYSNSDEEPMIPEEDMKTFKTVEPDFDDNKEEKKSLFREYWDVLKFSSNKKMLTLIPYMIFCGTLQGNTSAFMYRVTTHSIQGEKPVEKDKKIALTMIVYGAAGVIAGQIMHRTLDKAVLRYYVRGVCTLFLGSVGLMYFVFHYQPEYQYVFIVIFDFFYFFKACFFVWVF